MNVIDSDGFRHGVAIILMNKKRKLLLAKRIGQPAWQFPQGGMQVGETPKDALFRELWEEVGLCAEDVRVLATTKKWLTYVLPDKLVRRKSVPLCLGQKQKWFLLELVSADSKIDLGKTATAEFDAWRWVSYWYPLSQVVSFKKEVYKKAMQEFASLVFDKKN